MLSSWSYVAVTTNGTAIQALRKTQNLSLREVGRRARMDPSHLWRIERGLKGASADTTTRIAAALAVPRAAITREEV